MRRSRINAAIDTATAFFERMGFRLPAFACWSPDEWLNAGPEADEARDCMLGWDVTDFGSGDFDQIGRTLFTLRNGRLDDPRYPKVYAEKIMFNPEGQRAPLHYHQSKMEDIINRGGGNVLITVWKAGPDNLPSDEPLVLSISGFTRQVSPGSTLRIEPGESICLPPKTFHQFWGEAGTGPSMSGEVSSVCSDKTDNYFLERRERFPAVDEDEPARHVLCSEYPRQHGQSSE